jgi:glycosyltransferase involved in cell wall biosynthesis
METPLISIIIPAYNEADYVAEALKSIKNQTYDRLETIVVPNACTDDTTKIAKELANRVIEIPEKGVSHAKNIGAEVAKGTVLAFMDADSQMKDDGKAKIRPLDDDRLRAKIFVYYSELLSRGSKYLSFIDSGAGAFTFTNKEIFEAIKSKYGQGFREDLKIMEDVEFLTKLKKNGNYNFITESCLYISMRRFIEEGYLKCFWEDSIDVFNPEGKTRKRWE